MCAFNRELFLKGNNDKHNTMTTKQTKETKETAIYSVQLFSTNRTN